MLLILFCTLLYCTGMCLLSTIVFFYQQRWAPKEKEETWPSDYKAKGGTKEEENWEADSPLGKNCRAAKTHRWIGSTTFSYQGNGVSFADIFIVLNAVVNLI